MLRASRSRQDAICHSLQSSSEGCPSESLERGSLRREANQYGALYPGSRQHARSNINLRHAGSLSFLQRRQASDSRGTKSLDFLRGRDEGWRAELGDDRDYRPNHPLPLKPTYYDTLHEYAARLEAILDPTTLIFVDEGDPGDEQSRAIALHLRSKWLGHGSDRHAGNREGIARFLQFYSRIGFVHEFSALDSVEMQRLLEQG